MGFRFRKSFKIAPGVKINLNKNSSSVTFGGKGAHYTVNSKGKKTASVGIPGTGLYYTESTTNKQTKTKRGDEMSKMNSNNGKSIGCLGWFGILLLIGLAINLYSYCWVPAIPALIYCLVSKKYQAKKIRNSLICGGVLITSLLVFIGLNAPSQLNSIDIDWGSNKFYIGDTIEVKIDGHPSDAQIKNLELSENSIANLKYSNGKAVVTFKKEGESSLFFIANKEIKSNSQKITVVDKAAEKAAQKAKEEAERLAAEKAAAEKAAAEKAAAEKAAAEQAAAEKAAAEKAAAEKAAAEKAAAEQAAAEQTAAEKAAAEQTAEPQEKMVWIPVSGSKYHRTASCSGMKNPSQVPLSEAQSRGFEPCKRCY